MDVVIAGGHGQIALLLGSSLAERGDRVRGLIRDPDQAGDLRERGIEPVLLDLEQDGDGDLADAIEGADAVVFAAGAGPGSGPERKRTVDRDGAVRLVGAASRAGVRRYVIISSMGAEDPPPGDEGMAPYLQAKAAADAAVAHSGLDFTIVRPGRLTDDPAAGRVDAGPDVQSGEIPRADVAAVLQAVLDDPGTIGATLRIAGGGVPIAEAVRAAAR